MKFTRWIVIFSLTLLGVFILFYTGLINAVYKADVTKISFLILAIFLGCSVRLGYGIFQGVKEFPGVEFLSSELIRLGLIGTICGFIYMLYFTFSGINIADAAATQSALVCMSKGMGTALYTTAAGLVCNLILRLQLFISDG